ncbi:MAG TPA: hypothetical protein VKV18_14595 [Chthonomonas sp.]|uniref:hypothetical protein n=1 Tax=Chthonomonas sp. TaxID=2282153 RepID=UPI002B4AE62F|nr:hypothetical protein [Chthonomonas sp.]HLI49899.1 hypothetical protein [Chthonomonas sp.]
MRREISPQMATIFIVITILVIAGVYYVFFNPFRHIPSPHPNSNAHPAGPMIPPPLPPNLIRHGPISSH